MTTAKASFSGIRVSLNNKDKWQKFHPFTEMLVTRSGRKLFPELEFNIKGLVPNVLYSVSLHLERVNNIKYKFTKNINTGTGIWKEESIVEHHFPIEKRQHEDGGMFGSHWMNSPVSFSQIYITNNSSFDKNSKINPIFVESMHRYQPVIIVKRLDYGYEDEFRFTMTKFMAVTAYQNPKIVELKKQNNKFSAGFLPGGKHYERSQKGTPRGRKRAIASEDSDSSPHSKATSPTKKVAKKPNRTPVAVPSPTKAPTSPKKPKHSQNHIGTPSTVVMTPSTMVTPPTMFSTSLGPSFGGFNNFQNQMMTPVVMVSPIPMTVINMAPPTGFPNQMMIPPVPVHTFPINQHYNPHGMWNMPQMIGAPMLPPYLIPGVHHSQMITHLGNTGNMQQMNPIFPHYPHLNGATANFNFKFQ